MNFYSWYRPLDKQIIMQTRWELLQIAKPDAPTLKLLSIRPTPKTKGLGK